MTADIAPTHVSRTRLGSFPRALPSDPDAPHVRSARVDVDAADSQGPLTPAWESIGYDEINWTYTPTGKRLLQKFSSERGGYHVRPHYVFCSGSGFGIPHWGSGNVYHEDADGNPIYDFTIVDQAYDAIVDAGHHVLVELGFTPRDLLGDEAAALTVVPSPTVYTSYEAGAWGYPPRDYDKWGGLVAALVEHCVQRYGEQEVSSWLWELWNEPDISYWRGSLDQFNRLYTVTARAVRSVLPTGKVGGPTVTDGGLEFLKGFLDYTSSRNEPLDFISFHTKGSYFTNREYRPIGSPPSEQLSPSSTKMINDIREFNRAIAQYEQYRQLPVYVDECDASVPAHFGTYDNPNYEFQNTEYYPVFQAKLMKKILDLNTEEVVQVERATSWSFYFEGERYFEGTRSFQTAGGVEKPLLNGYRMLSLLGTERIAATSDAGWTLDDLDPEAGRSMGEEVDALASRAEDGTLAILVWRHTDDQYRTSTDEATVRLTVRNAPVGTLGLTHYRIDAEHSNAHTRWKELGSPQDPTPEQLTKITARQGLEELEETTTVQADPDGTITIDVSLPLPAASLLLLRPERR
ncbi:GH39 family glycosyl hydrolase [Microlunatus soli]|uniref:Xylan 1,4-beta-xylosidase n=1 Tax=Microlunatus soli TaxID=630515 RepID=A0A1H1WBL7_9ACTN|nr:glycoside hydrolase [Microlunatus soli]SDS94474.1 xylan 1,4-beta-xylosidase [Microlunatus soli]